MKVFHISDLHIGKQLYAYSLREEQEDILHQIVEQAAIHRPGCDIDRMVIYMIIGAVG